MNPGHAGQIKSMKPSIMLLDQIMQLMLNNAIYLDNECHKTREVRVELGLQIYGSQVQFQRCAKFLLSLKLDKKIVMDKFGDGYSCENIL